MTIPNDFLVMSCRWMFVRLDHYLEEKNLGAKNKDEMLIEEHLFCFHEITGKIFRKKQILQMALLSFENNRYCIDRNFELP